MAKSESWFKFYTEAYLRDTTTLSLTEHGAYIKLLAYQYQRNEPLPLNIDSIYRIAGVLNKEERDAVDHILTLFFDQKKQGFWNKKAHQVINERTTLSRKRSDAGKKGSEENEKKAEANRQQMLPRSQRSRGYNLLPSNEVNKLNPPTTPAREAVGEVKTQATTKAKKAVGQYTLGFQRFWDVYPSRNGAKTGKQEAFRVWERDGLEAKADQIAESVSRHAKTEQWQKEAGRYVPLATTFLNQARWLDEVVATGSPGRLREDAIKAAWKAGKALEHPLLGVGSPTKLNPVNAALVPVSIDIATQFEYTKPDGTKNTFKISEFRIAYA